MLYALLEYLEKHFDFPGAGLFQYLSFRSVGAIILSLLLVIMFGRKIINLLSRLQIGEEVRDLGLAGQMEKRGTPTMGGLIILGGVLIPMFLLGDLNNIYVQIMLVATIWLGTIGFLDDYIKVFRKNKNGLKGRFKIVGQVGLGIIVGTIMSFNQQVLVVEDLHKSPPPQTQTVSVDENDGIRNPADPYHISAESRGIQSTKTTIPFIKNNEFDYHWVFPTDKPWGNLLTWILYIAVSILIITAVSNGANLTDGLDGLATGVSAIIAVALGIFAYLSGNIIYAGYLNIMYIPGSGELMVFAMALVGALIGFLWFNCYPAQVFMGDTGSLALGGIIATFALLVRKELLLPILCGIFFMESVSVIIQVAYFKHTKKKYGEGKRFYLMAPMHHHYQKQGMPENKIVVRFWIVQILLAALTLVTLKIR